MSAIAILNTLKLISNTLTDYSSKAKHTANFQRKFSSQIFNDKNILVKLVESARSWDIAFICQAYEIGQLNSLPFDLGQTAIFIYVNDANNLEIGIIIRGPKIVKLYSQGLLENDELVEHNIDYLIEISRKTLSYKELTKRGVELPISFEPEGDLLVVLSGFILSPLVSESTNSIQKTSVMKPVTRLLKLLHSEKKDIWIIYLYASLIGLTSLSLPLGIQAIVSFISGGVIFNSVTLLITLVIVGLILVGGLQIMQLTMVELLQRRVFTRAAYEFSTKIPKIRQEALLNIYPPELMNRFFDILTVQKALPKLLIDLTSNSLQIIFGFILISFYHPFFIIYSIILLVLVVLTFRFTARKGVESSLRVSKYKYKIVEWFEDLSRSMNSFKMAGFTTLPIDKTDQLLTNYLDSRKAHYSVLLSHYITLVVFRTFMVGGLLIIGSTLVVNREISLGQFVASEIVIILIIAAVEKLILSIEVVYDALTAVEKLGSVTDLPEEEDLVLGAIPNFERVSLAIKNLSYNFLDNNKPALNNINLEILPGERICICGPNGSGKHTLIRVLTGMLNDYQGTIMVNGFNIRDISLSSLRELIACNYSNTEIFEGSIEENISLGRPKVSPNLVYEAIRVSSLEDWIAEQPQGINTNLLAEARGHPVSIARKIMLARTLVGNPKMLILEDFIQNVDRLDMRQTITNLSNQQENWTLIGLSNNQNFMKLCDRIIGLENGEITYDGNLEGFKDTNLFKTLVS